MPLYPIRNLGAVGVIRDLDPYDLPPNAFSNGLNVSISGSAIAKAVGYNSVSGLTDIVHGVGWLNTVENSHIYAKTDGSIWKWNGSILTAFDTAITNNGIGYYQSTMSGSHIIINNGVDNPFTAAPSDTSLNEMANWQSTWRSGFPQFVGVDYLRSIRMAAR